ncbi:MAG: hypothetical protein U0411_14390 [Thermodesulfovibrionales bacterium]
MEPMHREFWLTSYLLLGVLSVLVGMTLQKRKARLHKRKKMLFIRRGWAYGRRIGWGAAKDRERQQGAGMSELSGV